MTTAEYAARLSEDILISAVMQPVQFHDIWSYSDTLPPERRLALAVLAEALNDLVRFRSARGRRARHLFRQAHDWVASNDREWPLSFVNLCEAFGLAVGPIRQWALAPVRPTRGAPAAQRGDEARLGKAA
jgi:hypothetical protein